jgi:hypothetical protein
MPTSGSLHGKRVLTAVSPGTSFLIIFFWSSCSTVTSSGRHPHSATEFYRSLHVIEPQPLKDFLQLHDILQGEEFFTKFERFRDVKYLFHYPDNEKMIYSLNRIMMQVGLFGLSAHNQKLLLPVMEQTDEWMQQQFHVLENEMNQFRTQSI